MITLRSTKGTALTHAEMDANTSELLSGQHAQVPATVGGKIGLGPTREYSWWDMVGVLQVFGDPVDASREVYRGGLKALMFSENDSAYVDFHMQHDYAVGTDMFIHVHWSHNSALVTGGSVTWGFEVMYAKGHNQDAFDEPVLISVTQNASTTQYQHMIAETQASTPGGAGVMLNTSHLEVDGILQCRLYLISNDLVVSGGPVPEPFAHMVDFHYKSTNIGTLNKSPSFYGV